jgi:hypothetical protein
MKHRPEADAPAAAVLLGVGATGIQAEVGPLVRMTGELRTGCLKRLNQRQVTDATLLDRSSEEPAVDEAYRHVRGGPARNVPPIRDGEWSPSEFDVSFVGVLEVMPTHLPARTARSINDRDT